MGTKKNIFVIIGSASSNSSNHRLVQYLQHQEQDTLDFTVMERLSVLPHFDPDRTLDDTPKSVAAFREQLKKADGLLICTPEYIFSIPSGLKNAIEWCVATTVLAQKPTALITASASGVKGHEELQLIMKTVEAHFTEGTTLLIQGIKGKIDSEGVIMDNKLRKSLKDLMDALKHLVH